MCRYAFKNYKSHYVCFACRKQWKQAPFEDQLAQRGQLEAFRRLKREAVLEARNEHRARSVSCPECRGLMADVGLDFRPPRSNATRAWTQLQATFTLGHAWHTCGCSGPGYVPTDQASYALYLRDRLRSYRRQLKRTEQPDAAESVAKRAAAAKHWAMLVARVEAELAQRGKRSARLA
jgi:hypothetical protein